MARGSLRSAIAALRSRNPDAADNHMELSSRRISELTSKDSPECLAAPLYIWAGRFGFIEEKSTELRAHLAWESVLPRKLRTPLDLVRLEADGGDAEGARAALSLLERNPDLDVEYPRLLVVLSGPAGIGKSRTALALGHNHLVRYGGERFVYLEAESLKEIIATRARSGGFSDWVDETVSADFIVLDDLGHAPPTDSFLAGLRLFLDRAINGNASMVLTLNYSAAELAKRWERSLPGSSEIVKAIISHRLVKYFRPVKFFPQPPRKS